MLFVILVLVVWGIYTFSMMKRKGTGFKLSNSLPLLTMISIIVTICLGLNFVGATSLIDGSYSINNSIAYWIIGEDGWSYNLFKSYFNYSLIVSILLILISAMIKYFED
ncbi:MAG TPA: hypothetical protein VIO64_02575 [Pseudobacteroides sp.]|uniref:hypothetical protein n=1 Tax=Pseudobacteroides sp. TaxID=1968840 RepID=UPI002F9497AA